MGCTQLTYEHAHTLPTADHPGCGDPPATPTHPEPLPAWPARAHRRLLARRPPPAAACLLAGGPAGGAAAA